MVEQYVVICKGSLRYGCPGFSCSAGNVTAKILISTHGHDDLRYFVTCSGLCMQIALCGQLIRHMHLLDELHKILVNRICIVIPKTPSVLELRCCILYNKN